MRLWTIQRYKTYEKLIQTGILKADDNEYHKDPYFKYAYNWMIEKMKYKGLVPPIGMCDPIWAWFQWEGKAKRRDMREKGYANRGETIVQLSVEVDNKDVLLSDFDLFHYVLNYWYLPIDEKDGDEFEKRYTDLGFEWHDLSNFKIQTQPMQVIRTEIEKSWQRIFDLELADDNFIYRSRNKKSIQATLWQLKLEQIVEAQVFTAK